MEIFISSSPDNPWIRELIRQVCIESWPVPMEEIAMCRTSFRHRWEWAETNSIGPVYALADDDCMPCPALNLSRIEELFQLDPRYGIIALADVHGNYRKDMVQESTCVGGIRFIRKGIVTEFPATFTGCDSEYYDLMTKAGYKSGICTEFTRLHLGEYHSLWRKRGKGNAG